MNSLAPFTDNQRAFIDRVKTSWLNIAEGGKRGGKNVLATLTYCMLLEDHPNKLHLIAGVSIATAKLNIIDCDGFGMANYFHGRYREGKYKDRDCLYVKTRTGEKIVLVSGGAKDGDEKLIKGNTYGMAYVTEANECHPKFLKEVMDRTTSSKDRKIFHDLNPKAPGHWYYEEILSHHIKMQNANSEYGYNYGHFTIADNMSISDDQLRKILSTYDKSNVWYKRDILGQRTAAEGRIYDMFSPANISKSVARDYTRYYLSIDYGTANPMSMGLWGKYDGKWYRVREYYWNSRKEGRQKTDEEYYKDMVNFLSEKDREGNIKEIRPTDIIIDPSAASYIQCVKKHGKYHVKPANNEVVPGICRVSTLFNAGILMINDCCKALLSEIDMYCWDTKSADDKPIKDNDHACDDMRYFVNTVLKREMRY